MPLKRITQRSGFGTEDTMRRSFLRVQRRAKRLRQALLRRLMMGEPQTAVQFGFNPVRSGG